MRAARGSDAGASDFRVASGAVVSAPTAWRRVVATRPSSRPAAPRISAPVQTEATRSGSWRRRKPSIAASWLCARHPGPPQTIVTSQGGASANPCRATTVRPPGQRDRTRGVRDRDRLDRRQNTRGHRDDTDRSAHVDRLYTVIEDNAEAGRFVASAHSRLCQHVPCAADRPCSLASRCPANFASRAPSRHHARPASAQPSCQDCITSRPRDERRWQHGRRTRICTE